MWYSPEASTLPDMGPVLQFIFNEYVQVEPFIRSSFQRTTTSNKLLYIELRASYLGTEFYTRYPSQVFSEAEYDEFIAVGVENEQYNATFENYYSTNQSQEQMVFIEGSVMESCTLIFDDDQAFGTVCIGISVDSMV